MFIALCRRADIPTRYKVFRGDMIRNWRDALIEIDPRMQKWYQAISCFMFEGEGKPSYLAGQMQ